MFGATDNFKPKHKKTAEYCRTKAFKQAHSIMSVFERKNTLQDLAKQSMRSMHSMRSMSDADRKNTMEELGRIVSLTNLWDDNNININSINNHEKSLTFSHSSHSPQPGHDDDNNDNNNPISGGGYNNASAGGAGALPTSTDIINLYSHFNGYDEGNDNDTGVKVIDTYKPCISHILYAT